LADDSGWIADRDNIGWQVADDDRARTHDGVIADSYSGTNDHATAQPDIIADRDRPGAFPLRPSRLGFDRMRRGEKLHVWPDLHVVTDCDLSDVKRYKAPIRECSGSDVDLETVVAKEWRADNSAFADASEPAKYLRNAL
jgi:hypothetical protein